jgi:hypothetical protein
LFRGEESEEATIGGMIVADMAVKIRYYLGGKPPGEGLPPPTAEEDQ